MNRRNFLKGSVGAAVAIAIGRSFIEPVEAGPISNVRVTKGIARYLTDPNAWYIKTDNPGGIKKFYRKARGAPIYKVDDGVSLNSVSHPCDPSIYDCDCTPMDWLPSTFRYRPDLDARLCHNCGGMISDERIEDWTGLKRRTSGQRHYVVGTDVGSGVDCTVIAEHRPDGTIGIVHQELSEMSLEQMLIEVKKHTAQGKPLTVKPTRFLGWPPLVRKPWWEV